jgi:hypothetical protein
MSEGYFSHLDGRVLTTFNSKNGKLQGAQMTMDSDGLAKLMFSLNK